MPTCSLGLYLAPSAREAVAGARSYERAMYAWGTSHVATLGARDTFVAFCEAQGVDTLFLDMYGMLGSSNYSAPNVAAMQDLIGRFKALGDAQKVYAVSGDPSWALDGYSAWIQANIVGNLVTYNAESAANERFDGFHYDIEYWVPESDPATSLTGLKAIYDGTVADSGLACGFFVSFWLIGVARTAVLWSGATKTDGEHIVDFADHIVVGSYRDTANFNALDDVDGAIGLMQDWYTDAVASATPLYSALETIDIAPAYTTFFGQSKAALEVEVALVNAAFEDAAYLGLAVHDYGGWSALS